MSTRTSIELLLAAALLLVACGGSNKGPGAGSAGSGEPQITDIERYLPLESDTVSAFATTTENTADKGVLMMHIERPRPNLAVLTVGGKSQRLDILPEGIRVAEGGWLLKAP